MSLGNHTCALRETAVKALAGIGRDGRPVCEISNMEPIFATLRADQALSVLQVSTVPEDLQALGAETGLPALSMFYINLHLPKAGAGELAVELARHIRRQFAARHHRAA